MALSNLPIISNVRRAIVRLRRNIRVWSLQPKHKRAGDIAQRFVAMMMLLGAISIYSADATRGTLLTFTTQISVVNIQQYAIWMFIFGLALVVLKRPSLSVLILFTSPILVYVYFSFIAVLQQSLNAQGAIFLILLYMILILMYWGSTE